MAMLAEKKRKVKWCLNPRGNDWAKDENKFGQRLLEKMGWEPGMGLGAKGQGRTDFVRLQIKSDTKGFGNKEKLDEMWSQQQQNFDQLLAQLNGEDESNKTNDSIKVSSLEDKSKNSRARVHYHKFTRGKDVSKYSSKDLNSIIGISKKPSDDSSEESTGNSNSMYEYFYKKSQMLKRSFIQNDKEEMFDSFDCTEKIELNGDTEESESINEGKKKKKKHIFFENEENLDGTIGDVEQNEIPIRKKKKKKKNENEGNCEVIEEIENDISENNKFSDKDIEPLVENVDNEVDTKPLKKKKKKRHKNVETF